MGAVYTNEVTLTVTSSGPDHSGNISDISMSMSVDTLGGESPYVNHRGAISSISMGMTADTIPGGYVVTGNISGISMSMSVDTLGGAVVADAPPTITNQPDNTTITIPNDGSLVVAGLGQAGHPLTWQWYHAEDDSLVVADAVYGGVTATELTITSPTSAYNGLQFYAIATDTINSLTTQTNTATITIAASVVTTGTVIKPLRSTTAGVVPTTANLEAGEFAMNIADQKMFTRDNSDNIVTLGGLYDGASLPTSDPAVAGALWNDGGTVKISAG